MSEGVKLKLTGVKELDAVLKGLPLQLNDKLLQQAHSKAARPLVEKAKLLAPDGATNNTEKSIGVVKASGKSLKTKRELGAIDVGPRRGGRYKGHVAHLNEFGTKQRYSRGRKKRFSIPAARGRMTPKPFMEPAWQATQSRVLGSITSDLAKVVTNYMKKTVKK